jgi:hypothetical protein
VCSFVLALAILFVSGCTKGIPGLLSGDNSTPAPQQMGAGGDGLASSSGMENSSSSGTEIVSSSGTVIPSSPGSNQPGSVGAYNPEAEMTLPPSPNRLIYVNPTYGFSISYPDSYEVLKEPELLTTIYPSLVLRVRFLDIELAHGETADLEPPKFSIEVYENPSPLPLTKWLDSNDVPRGTHEDIKVDTVSCTQITMPILMAPNQFVYCAFKNNIYKFTPLGPFSQDMLKSFKFGR